jgi:hypothetical protein
VLTFYTNAAYGMVQVILTARPRYNAFLVLCKTKKGVKETISSGAGKNPKGTTRRYQKE